ncbi:MAG: FAD-dependent oxidoreductase [Candidatus Omnitrophica bacterium]|nr:FAD-dependent oxidoreductase [Candidatus Omnitrophota bacterium]
MKQSQKTKVVIIGSGFAGLSSALGLSRVNRDLEITVIDRKETSDFLPSLPDILGRGISPKVLAYDIKLIAKKNGFEFIKKEVSAIDLSGKKVYVGNKKIDTSTPLSISSTSLGTVNLSNHNPERAKRAEWVDYDYLVIASGSETNFYGNDNIKESAYTLDSANDAVKIITALKGNCFDTFIIGGGGYTGIEVATNLRKFSLEKKQKTKIIIVEKSESILGPLPQWMKDYATGNLSGLNIEILTKSSIDRIEGSSVNVTGQKIFNNALVIWAAGVKTAKFIQELSAEKNAQGRLMVDEYLRLDKNCFVAGDAAYIKYGKNYLRMAVQFAIAQGNLTARNIISSIKGKKLLEYKPLDLGYIIPMANNYSCGNVFGVNLRGKLPTLLHFIMCIYRLRGVRKKIGFIKNLIGIRQYCT